MLPTLTDGDKIIVSVGEKNYEYKDIVVIAQPGVINEPLVKRVVATGGQWVDVDYEAGIVYVGNTAENLLPLEEDYIFEPATDKNADDTNEYPVFVPEGKLFVLGDNRNNSTDSRSCMVGLIDEDYVLGKVLQGIWSAKNGFGLSTFNI